MFEPASVAQSVVHLTRNEKVACSSQVTSSKKAWFVLKTNQAFLMMFALQMVLAAPMMFPVEMMSLREC